MTNTLHFSEWINCSRAQRKVNLCAPGAPKGPKVGMFVRQYEILCANDAGRAPRKYPGNELCFDKVKVATHFNDFFTSNAASLVNKLPACSGQFGQSHVVEFYRNKHVTEDMFSNCRTGV